MPKTHLTFYFAYTLLLILASGCCQQQPCRQQILRVMSYNIRFDNPDDGINSWPHRKERVADMLLFYQADVICLQEALHHQLKDLTTQMPGFSISGKGRDDGDIGGEFSAILYNPEVYSLLQDGTFWLSPTPSVPSPGWDAAVIRICSWAEFEHRKSHKRFFVFNTHFDHVGQVARIKSSELLLYAIDSIASGFPVIFCGDLNAEPDNEAIVLLASQLRDARIHSLAKPYGPYGTWNGFDYNSPLDRRIDYVFTNQHVEVLRYAVIDDAFHSRFPSDHLPVFTELVIK